MTPHRTCSPGLLWIGMGVVLFLAGCSTGKVVDSSKINSGSASDGRPRIIAVSYALQYLTQAIAGDGIEVQFPAAQADSPADWKPTAEQVAQIQSADLIVVNGPGPTYAHWLVRVSLPESRIVHASQNLPLADFIRVEDYRIEHQHGPEGKHSHAYLVPFTWLDPAVAGRQADQIAQALTARFPAQAATFQSNRKHLQDELTKLSQALAEVPDRPVLATTPELQFLTRAAGAQESHLLWFAPPTIDAWRATERQAVKERIDQTGARAMLVTRPLPRAIQTDLRAMGLTLVPIQLLDRPPADGDYLAAMADNIQRLQSALAE